MNEELLAALERLEREKGISKEVLFAAIESALASAAVKIISSQDVSKEDITVKMNQETGEIKVYQGKKEVKSEQFGRIAAQTAKQVMIQKIREAERDVISEKYLHMEGTIISGSVHRFDRGNIIVELDDAEAVLPKPEQIPRERFRQGETIRAYLLKVERKTGGVDIILSRSDIGFIKKLFELEVPEITQGVVEIKGIAREAGERTKIAVVSKDERIDSVGACVGMHGSRVKEIVKELSGERIDIVRWSDDIREYVAAAVSPVEIYSMEINRDAKEIKLTVPKDQLALLIGKKGRNIRVASKLLGWDLQAEAEMMDIPLVEVTGLDEEVLKSLEDCGCSSASQVLERGVEGLMEIEGVDEETAGKIISACESAIEAASKTEAEEKKPAKEPEEKVEAEEKEKAKETPKEKPQETPKEEPEEAPKEEAGETKEEEETPKEEPEEAPKEEPQEETPEKNEE